MAHWQIEVVDEHDQPIGLFPKEEVWGKGLLHRIVRVMIEDNRGRVLLQKRSSKMDTFPNCWDHSAAGHVDQGESYKQAAMRETKEEIGIVPDKLEEVAHYHTKNTFQGRILNRFNKLYRAKVTNASFRLQPSEVNEVRWFTVEEIKKLINDHPDQVTDGIRQVIKDYY